MSDTFTGSLAFRRRDAAGDSTPGVPFGLPLTPYERFMWRNRQPGCRPIFFSFWLALRGEIDRSVLDAALNETIAWHPLLRAAIVGRGRRARWISAATTELHVEWLAGGSRTPVDPPDVSRGVCLRVVGGTRPRGVDLAFHFHHSCLDGVGAMEFLGDLFASYSQLAAGRRAEPLRPLDPEALRHRTSAGGVPPMRRALVRFAKALAFRPAVLAAERGPRGALDAIFRLPEARFDAVETASLRRLAHAAEASLNDLLIAEIMRAISRQNAARGGGNRIRILMPVNIRDASHADAPAANFVAYEALDRTIRNETDPTELVKSVRDQTGAIKRARRETWLDEWVSLLASKPALMDVTLRFPVPFYTGIVTNLGNPADRFWSHLAQTDGTIRVGRAVVEGVGCVPPVQARSCLSLGVTSYAGELSITGKACPKTIGAAELERFLRLLGEQLRARIRHERPAVMRTSA